MHQEKPPVQPLTHRANEDHQAEKDESTKQPLTRQPLIDRRDSALSDWEESIWTEAFESSYGNGAEKSLFQQCTKRLVSEVIETLCTEKGNAHWDVKCFWERMQTDYETPLQVGILDKKIPSDDTLNELLFARVFGRRAFKKDQRDPHRGVIELGIRKKRSARLDPNKNSFE